MGPMETTEYYRDPASRWLIAQAENSIDGEVIVDEAAVHDSCFSPELRRICIRPGLSLADLAHLLAYGALGICVGTEGLDGVRPFPPRLVWSA